MMGARIEAFLKLFCITESSNGSWQSWTVLCICFASAIATASSGSYFQKTNAVKSSLVCFIISTAGFGMALVTLLAILIGCKRRRRISDPEATYAEPTIYANPVALEESTSIRIERDPSDSDTVEQMWMNPVFTESNKSLYEAEWNKEKGKEIRDEKDNEKYIGKDNDAYVENYSETDFDEKNNEKLFEKNNENYIGKDNGTCVENDSETDFDEKDSDYFHSSSETMTWSNNSYSDEGYFHHSSKESNFKGNGKNSLERHQEKLKDGIPQTSSNDLKEAVNSTKHSRKRVLMHQELQVLKQSGNNNGNSVYLTRYKISNSSESSDECQILSNSIRYVPAVVKIEDHTQSTDRSFQRNPLTAQNVLEDSTMPHETCPSMHEMSYSNLSYSNQEELSMHQNRHSIYKFDYPFFPYPVFDEDYSNSECLERLKERKDIYIPRYEKRPLLNINGEPISQKELVKVITRLLISGLKQTPKNVSESETLEQ